MRGMRLAWASGRSWEIWRGTLLQVVGDCRQEDATKRGAMEMAVALAVAPLVRLGLSSARKLRDGRFTKPIPAPIRPLRRLAFESERTEGSHAFGPVGT